MNRTFVLLWMLVTIGCRTAALTMTVEENPPATPAAPPGVDSLIATYAVALAGESFARDETEAGRLAADGRRFAQMADSLLGLHSRAQVSILRDSVKATEYYNEGADALEAWDKIVDDSSKALDLLQQAASAFEAALDADPFDSETQYWLGHVYQLQAEHYNLHESAQAATSVLQKLVSLHQNRHDYIGLLARNYDRVATQPTSLLAGSLWERAALVAVDDAALDPDGQIVADSAAIFVYLLRSSRSFSEANQANQALRVLDIAALWAAAADEIELVEGERSWLMWDGANLQTRITYDRILEQASRVPQKAARELEELLADVKTPAARVDVKHQLTLAWYGSGRQSDALELMHDLWQSRAEMATEQVGGIRSDYAVMAYNLAQRQRQRGNLTGALTYLLQCEQLDAPLSARAALQAAQLLSNNPEAALDRAMAAERRINDLSRDDQARLLRYTVELHRRLGDRDRAREYFERLGEL